MANPKFCSKCGIEQRVPGFCWDNGKCSKCFNKESMADIIMGKHDA